MVAGNVAITQIVRQELKAEQINVKDMVAENVAITQIVRQVLKVEQINV
jgi:predicted proteasome-type protease